RGFRVRSTLAGFLVCPEQFLQEAFRNEPDLLWSAPCRRCLPGSPHHSLNDARSRLLGPSRYWACMHLRHSEGALHGRQATRAAIRTEGEQGKPRSEWGNERLAYHLPAN